MTLDFEHDAALRARRCRSRTTGPADADDGVVLETWFNPIVTQSLFMPGWFEEHWDNMRRYRT